MKKFAGVIALLAVLAVALLAYYRTRPAVQDNPAFGRQTIGVQSRDSNGPPPTARVVVSTNLSASPPAANPAGNLAARAGQVIPVATPTDLPPDTVLQNLHRAIHQFGQMYGGNPVGTNPEITAALTGHNPKGINFLRDQPGMTVNAKGELVDSWGTPYFFHQISGSDMELHSAGPDRIMWTADDLVIK